MKGINEMNEKKCGNVMKGTENIGMEFLFNVGMEQEKKKIKAVFPLFCSRVCEKFTFESCENTVGSTAILCVAVCAFDVGKSVSWWFEPVSH